MIVAKIIGHVVSTTKDHRLNGKKLLVVQPVELESMDMDGKPLVAVDTVGAGQGEIVMVVSGSSARQTDLTAGTPVDAAIIGIIDQIELHGQLTYHMNQGRDEA